MSAKIGRGTVRIAVAVAIIGILAVALLVLSRSRENSAIKIGIIEPLQHIAVSDITRGIKDGLGSEPSRFEVLVQNANGDKSTIAQIIAQYQDKNVGVYVPIFTGTAQAVKANVGNHNIVFAAVTDPVAAGLLKNPKKPGGNITGVSDLWPIASELQLIRKILPSARTIGIVYDPGDPSAAATMSVLTEECNRQGFRLVTRPVTASNEVPQALASLGSGIDLIFTANDVTVTAAFPALVEFSVRNKKPLFAGDYSSVQRGAIAAVGQSYYNVGVAAGKIIRQLGAGTSPGSIPVVYTSGAEVYLNASAAEQMGVQLPQGVLQGAKKVYTSISTANNTQ
jgi:putative tryptophan/tyrosine transport system substrate-binding protein